MNGAAMGLVDLRRRPAGEASGRGEHRRHGSVGEGAACEWAGPAVMPGSHVPDLREQAHERPVLAAAGQARHRAFAAFGREIASRDSAAGDMFYVLGHTWVIIPALRQFAPGRGRGSTWIAAQVDDSPEQPGVLIMKNCLISIAVALLFCLELPAQAADTAQPVRMGCGLMTFDTVPGWGLGPDGSRSSGLATAAS